MLNKILGDPSQGQANKKNAILTEKLVKIGGLSLTWAKNGWPKHNLGQKKSGPA